MAVYGNVGSGWEKLPPEQWPPNSGKALARAVQKDGVQCGLGSTRLCSALQRADMPKEVGVATEGTLPLLGWVLFPAPYLGTRPGPEAGPRPGEQYHRVPDGGGEA